MGIQITGQGDTVLPPLEVDRGPGPLRAIRYEVPVPSAQVKSAVLLAGLVGDGPTTVIETVRTRTNTEEMLAEAGVRVTVRDVADGREVTVEPGRPQPRSWFVPGDPSQAAFFLVAGLLAGEGQITVTDLYGGAERLGFVSVLERMGADLETRPRNGVVDLVARPSALRGTEVHSREIPSVDEIPILAVAACAAEGLTCFRDVGELRIKESDRLSGTVRLATAIGASAHVDGHDLIIGGIGSAARFSRIDFVADLDHRMVMSAAIAGAVGHGADIDGTETVASSYPRFFADLASLR
jgi:3-phosphoshikimate 1-carboxyvinyltransferase